MIRIKSDRIIIGKELFDGYLYLDGGVIADVSTEARPADEELDLTGRYVSAGFIDTHTHGAGGISFMTCTPDEVKEACGYHMRHGTTSILPTLSTCSYETMRSAVESIDAAMKSSPDCNVIGAHLEGPYLSAAQCGAQSPTLITPPIREHYTALIADFPGAIARWTYAPENDKDGEFARYITERGIVASAGHSDAKYPDMVTAIENGCSLITHLYSATSTVTRDHGFRSLGVIESTYLRDELTAEIIADGKHLPPDLVRMIVKIKGMDKVALVTDSLDIAATDMVAGQFKGGSAFIVEDGVCKLPDRTAFAGSIATADRLVRVMRDECGFDLVDAVRMMTATPAALLGLYKGSIKAGLDADIIVFDEGVNVTDVFVGGIKMI